ncbi:MAG: hypothetical protein A3K19_13580 [Lentisphaerae bacterium RIFOXYB12_FULL_65_16]|nr:MAG: hypothetical protein A3K18_05380 [Lentisphaerae bacterium RIFOXYA12_64_32]OGV93067.1 MAG: hypothetical protein A3K19_13580 [Lentisphaerae bacterium RIFOXYB12_FULL_65_16]
MPIKLTASTFSFCQAFREKRLDIARYIETCADLGFTAIELNDGFLKADPAMPVKETKRRAIALGLDVAAIAIESVFVRNNAREIAREKRNILDWLETAYAFGAPVLRVNTGQMVNTLETLRNRRVTWDTVRGWVADTFEAVVLRAERLGIVIAMENHYCATRTAADTLALVRRIDSPWFKVNIDTGNFYEDIRYGNDFVAHPEILADARPFEDVYAGIDALAAEMIYCHAKIYKLDAAGENDLLLDYDRIFRIYRQHGYRGYISIENFSAEDAIDINSRAAQMLARKWDRCCAR